MFQENNEEEISQAIDELSEQQRTMVEAVLKRAAESRRGARVVIDANQLAQMSRRRAAFREGTGSIEIEHRLSLVQMDSIPENVVTCDLSNEPPSTARQPPEEQKSLRGKLQKMKSHLTAWFNSLDYDGDYAEFLQPIGDGTPTPELCSLTMTYINTLSEAILVAAHISLCQRMLANSEKFQKLCEELCKSIFELAYKDLERANVDVGRRGLIDEFCAQIADDALQAIYYSYILRTLPERVPSVERLCEIHKSKSFENAVKLDEMLSSEDEEEERRYDDVLGGG
ncbi:unnamed protein product [Caenorhabditis auriculariae]|uniref:Uncharacterized protein n=1 Tax=Caenorhabditis auriculariae TaxID=2777116 RepID=A0A8S1HGU0_9PELO|nr:unnamed protein product [Caenorhabditis auriculariae]